MCAGCEFATASFERHLVLQSSFVVACCQNCIHRLKPLPLALFITITICKSSLHTR